MCVYDMEIKYKVSKYHSDKIKPYVIEKTTDKCVFYYYTLEMGDGDIRYNPDNAQKELKENNWHIWFDTWEEAHAYVTRFLKKSVNNLKATLSSNENKLEKMVKMDKPDYKISELKQEGKLIL